MALPYRTKLCGTFWAFTILVEKLVNNFLMVLNLKITLISSALKYKVNTIHGEVTGFTTSLKCLSITRVE